MNPETLERVRTRVQRIESMPAIPVILRPLLHCLDQPLESIDVERVVELVSYDKSIAAQCLRMANSALYGRRNTVDTVRGAVVSLGLWRVRDLLFSFSLTDMIPADRWVVDPVVFWRHSLGCAFVSRKLAQMIRFPDLEKAYLAGLLHDLGLLANSVAFAEDFRSALALALSQQIPLHEAEQSVLGFTHCESGRLLSDHWRIPEELGNVVEFHHDVTRSCGSKALVALAHLSDLLCRLRGLGYGYYESRQVDFASDPAWEILTGTCPDLDSFDLARFTFELDAYAQEVCLMVESVFSAREANQ
jgi:HD-like signal output (HDOD) protein